MLLEGSYKTLKGEEVDLSDYLGQVVLISNTASLCGFTKQYAMLEEVYQQYKDQGLVVLGFPSGSFSNQELETSEEIASFCQKNYGVSFPLFQKSDVLEENPLFLQLADVSKEPGWNFTKYLLDRQGNFAARFASKYDHDEMIKEIELLLEGNAEGESDEN